MCLAIPMRVKSVKGDEAIVEVSGVEYKANIQLLDDVKIGDYLIVHAGFAIEKLDEEEASKSLDAWAEVIATLEKRNNKSGND
ncbi:MAG: HypC/HybG/HupF family hydrogenase formation chaperone [Candidatus Marinimicrobia bacterium]|nr:HypC/HybG/HupF family hydrogenase formation chaperone [Candidatus Neomarinimicrobiota bacterium]